MPGAPPGTRDFQPGRSALRAVLFDAVGTLILLREPVGETYARFARGQGVVLPPEQIEDAFARIFRTLPPMAFPDLPLERRPARERAWWHEVVRRTFRAADGCAVFSDFDALADALFAHYAGAGAWRVADGALECLDALRDAGLRIGVVSNFDHRLPPLLDSLGFARAFDVIALPGEAGAAKPDPAIFAFALQRLDAGAGEAIVVGDDPREDVAGARAAGLRAIELAPPATLQSLAQRILSGDPDTERCRDGRSSEPSQERSE